MTTLDIMAQDSEFWMAMISDNDKEIALHLAYKGTLRQAIREARKALDADYSLEINVIRAYSYAVNNFENYVELIFDSGNSVRINRDTIKVRSAYRLTALQEQLVSDYIMAVL